MSSIEDIAVLTSENVRLTYTLSGLGSRLAAFLADTVLIGLASVALTFIFMSMGMRLSDLSTIAYGGTAESPLMTSLYIILTTLLYWGYYFFFEWINWGMTPGKQLLGIRVATSDGASADIVACAVRNVIRIVDLGLAMLGITFFIVVFTPRFQRLGDLAAGTVVVRRRQLSFDDVIAAAHAADRSATVLANDKEAPAFQVKLTDAEKGLIERFLSRRESLPLNVREDLARDLAAQIRSKAVGESAEELGDEALIQAAWSQVPRQT